MRGRGTTRRGGTRGAAALLGAAALSAAGCGERAAPDTSPGVSLALAEHRARTLSDVRYDLTFRVPAGTGDEVVGRARIRFSLSRRGPVVLDFDAPAGRVRAVRAGAGEGAGEGAARLEPVAFGFRDGHIVVPAAALRRGENAVEVEFAAGDEPLNRNPDYLYTLFVPDRARRAFPCFDQPDLKARFRLTLEVPEGWVAVANGPAESMEALPEDARSGGEAGDGEDGGEGGSEGSGQGGSEGRGAGVEPAWTPGRHVTYRFAETPPLPTYLFSFAAGAFRVEEAERAGRRLRMFHRETDSAKVARNRGAIFDLHGKALAWLEEYTGIPYPFEKFDFVVIPAFQYNGMEHPGAILYRAETLLLDESATKTQELARASVIAHETAHMWFGNLVTMRWFDDVWMKEVFANFLAAKIVHPSFPEIDHDLRFVLAHHPAAYAVDRTAGANPIRQRLENLSEAGTLYGAIIYQKAPVVMRQLELLLGEAALREGLREYLREFSFGSAGWPELVAVLDHRTAENLPAWSRVWVEEPGRPTVRVSLALEGAADGGGRRPGGRGGGARAGR